MTALRLEVRRWTNLSTRPLWERGSGEMVSGDRASVASGGDLDPFDEATLARYRDRLVTGAATGTGPVDVRDDLAQDLWPWAQRVAARAASRYRGRVDPAEVHSQVAAALWHCCSRFDLDQGPEWSAWLTTRVRGAVLDSARHADHLSRRDRAAVRAGLAVDSSTNSVPLHEITEPAAADADPVDRVVHLAAAAEVRRWLEEDLPADVADRLRRWWDATGAATALPPPLAREVAPFTYRLLAAADLVL